MYSARGNAVLPALGFPIRESTDQWLFSAYPWLFAAVHALLRLLVPRHPPCALPILTVIAVSARGCSRIRPELRSLTLTMFQRAAVKPLTGTDGDTRLLTWLCSFQGPRKRRTPGFGGRSLKTQQHAAPSSRRSGAARPGRRFGSRSSCAGTVCAGRRAAAPVLELP